MVKHIGYLVLAASMTATTAYAEVSWDDFNQSIGDGEEAIDYSGTLVPHDKLHELIPEDDAQDIEKVPSKEDRGKSTQLDALQAVGERSGDQKANEGKESTNASEDRNPPGDAQQVWEKPGDVKQVQKASAANTLQDNSTYVYISPSLSKDRASESQRNNVLFHAPKASTVKFGIPIGTKIKVSMTASASNIVDDVVLVVQETVKGQIRDLTRGSKLFASTDAVIGSERLYLKINKGLVPGDLEHFRLTGTVYADDGDPGLLANVVSDGKTIQRAFVDSSSALAEGLIDVVGGGTMAGEAGKAGAKSILSEKEKEQDNRNGRPAYIVQAAPQKAFLFVEDTF